MRSNPRVFRPSAGEYPGGSSFSFEPMRCVAAAQPPEGIIIGLIFWLLFFGYIIWNELRTVLRQKAVTGETISLSLSIYLLMGLTWAVFYVFLYYLQPHAFNMVNPSTSVPSSAEVLIVYFSLTTISTIGFGDITPLTLQARYAAVAEGIAGQFYLAILVARLVGLHMSHTAGHETGH